MEGFGVAGIGFAGFSFLFAGLGLARFGLRVAAAYPLLEYSKRTYCNVSLSMSRAVGSSRTVGNWIVDNRTNFETPMQFIEDITNFTERRVCSNINLPRLERSGILRPFGVEGTQDSPWPDGGLPIATFYFNLKGLVARLT
jgi:hypothetical protein